MKAKFVHVKNNHTINIDRKFRNRELNKIDGVCGGYNVATITGEIRSFEASN